ncbi:uncharacterized protein LOC116303414 isoform X2 [Actinia tenebrosa]|uniref:Uncharacterized protein LOC116303414 isoform X2 n=1 Tax=Actinia tenebrosa TaxID=6105 RepID=A0A6P8IP43_ACTTE|nr:uncharacterized protein LOC116303414 isoform X2 [Actinia tenebrosa]
MSNNTTTEHYDYPTTAPVPVNNGTLPTNSTIKTYLQTGSLMNKYACSCSIEVCAKEHFGLIVSVCALNLFFLIIVTLCICTKRNCSKKSRHDIEAKKMTTLERTTAEQSDNQSPTAITPIAAPPRKPLPLPPSSSRQPSTAYTEHPTHLEIISDNSFHYQEQNIDDDSQDIKTPGFRRALIPPPQRRHRLPNAPQPSSSMETNYYEVSSYLRPQEGLVVQGTSPYAELTYQRRESRADSTTKNKGYLGLNSLTRIRAKMKKNRTSNE